MLLLVVNRDCCSGCICNLVWFCWDLTNKLSKTSSDKKFIVLSLPNSIMQLFLLLTQKLVGKKLGSISQSTRVHYTDKCFWFLELFSTLTITEQLQYYSRYFYLRWHSECLFLDIFLMWLRKIKSVIGSNKNWEEYDACLIYYWRHSRACALCIRI